MQVKETVVRWRGIDLEVASMNYYAKRRVNGQRDTIHEAVRDLNRINGERSDRETHAGTNLAQVSIIEQVVLFQLVFHQGQCELSAKDRHAQFREDPRQPANMVFMPVGEDNATDLF